MLRLNSNRKVYSIDVITYNLSDLDLEVTKSLKTYLRKQQM